MSMAKQSSIILVPVRSGASAAPSSLGVRRPSVIPSPIAFSTVSFAV